MSPARRKAAAPPPPSDQELLAQLTSADADARAKRIEGWFAADRATAIAQVRRLLTLVHGLRSAVPLRAKGAFACLVALAKHLDAGEPLPPEADLALTFAEDQAMVRGLLERIPPARRVAMFEAWLAEGSWSRYLMPYLDLAPAAAAAIFEQARAKGALRETLGFVTHRSAELEPIVRRFEALLEAPPPPRPPRVGSFRFVEPTRVLPRDYDALSAVAQAQYRQVAGSYVESGRVKDPKDFIRQLKREALNEGDAELRRWKVLRGDEHVFDLWVVWVENGMFFRAGSPDQVPVSIIQGSYLPKTDAPDVVELAEDLAASERESLWAVVTS